MRNDFESNYLAHHGILGQKWGKKNGPPYPLGASDHSASEKKAGYKKSLGGGRNEELYNRKSKSSDNNGSKKSFHLTDSQKKALKIGAVAVGLTAAAIGTAYLVKSGKMGKLIEAGENFVGGKIRRNIDPTTGLKKFTEIPKDKNAIINGVNPKFSWSNQGSTMNCGNCALALEARTRGFDVTAKMNETGMTFQQLASNFKGIRSDSICEPTISGPLLNWNNPNLDYDDMVNFGNNVKNQLETALAKQYPSGARGVLTFPAHGGAHFISFEKTGNSINWINSQEPDADLVADWFCKYKYNRNDMNASLVALRYDDLEFNNTVSEFVANNTKGFVDKVMNLKTNSKKFDVLVTKGNNWVTSTVDLFNK